MSAAELGRQLADDAMAGIERDNPGPRGKCVDVLGFRKSASLDEVSKHAHVLTPGRYVGAEAQEDDGEPFEQKMRRFIATLREQQAEAAKLDAAIAANLAALGFALENKARCSIRTT